MSSSLLTGDMQSDEIYSEEFQKPPPDQEERDYQSSSLNLEEEEEDDEQLMEGSNSNTENTASILRRSEQKERPKLKKRVSFDQESIERKRGKVSRRPRRRRSVPVTTPLRDFIAIMAMFLLTALLSSILRDHQRQAQQNYLNRKAQAKQKGSLSARRKRWQQKQKENQQLEPAEEPGSIDELEIVSSDLSSQVNTESQENDIHKVEQILRSDASPTDEVVDSDGEQEELQPSNDVSNEMKGTTDNIPEEDTSSNNDNSMNDSHAESSEAPFTEVPVSPDSENEDEMVLTHGSQGEHVEL